MSPHEEASLGTFTEAVPLFPNVAGRLLRRYRAPSMAVADATVMSGACLAAYVLRFHSPTAASILPVKEAIPDPIAYAVISVIMTLAWTFLMWQQGLYRSSLCSMRPMSDELRVVLSAGFRSLALVMVATFLFRALVISRIFLSMGFALALALVVWMRLLSSHVLKRLASKNVPLDRFALLGTGPASRGIFQRLSHLSPMAGIVGLIGLAPGEGVGQDLPDGLPVLGDASSMEAIIKDHRVTGVIFASNGYAYEGDSQMKEALMQAVNCCEASGMPFYMIPDALNVAVRRNEVGSCCGLPIIELRDAAVHPLYGAAKRLMDLLVAAVGLVTGLPIWLTVAAAVKLTSRGPVLFVQERIDRNGRVFRMYKFRTMVEDAPARLKDLVDLDALSEPVFKIKNDPRVTPVGRFLRRAGLDEAPQLFNVLKGEMSLVGPRPEQVELVERYDAWQRRRLKARPGITGYQQVMSRGETSLERRIHYDLYYLKNQSLLLDLLILLKTIVVVVRGDGIT